MRVTLFLFFMVAPAWCLQQAVTTRRALLRGAGTASLLPLIANAGGVPEGMKTSESYSNLQQISPEVPTLGLQPTTSRGPVLLFS